jgi:hypothetical protein
MANRAYAELFGKRTLAPVSVHAAFPELRGATPARQDGVIVPTHSFAKLRCRNP